VSSLVIVIATYQRVSLLCSLLEDIARQTVQPEGVIIVDGDPASGEVLAMLKALQPALQMALHYIPSNHGNLSYQRYLGWKSASNYNPEFMIYFDDDIRLPEKDTLAKLIDVFDNPEIVGATAKTITGSLSKFNEEPAIAELRVKRRPNRMVDLLGDARKYDPGGYTPVGNRIMPAETIQPISEVHWLQGRVMAYRMDAVTSDCFLEDLFALTHIRCGLGEDSILSRQIGKNGKLVMVNGLTIEHPDDAMPNSYPIKAYSLANATAYSRRFLNDHYRITEPPHLADRVALLKSYLGNNLINFARAVAHPRRHRWAYAWGYLRGSLRGLLQKPTAKNLTPEIDWWLDAEDALRGQVRITP